ncbi:MAG: D-xylose 1-dehydrogenase Gfo6 [Halobacteriales archaeon]
MVLDLDADAILERDWGAGADGRLRVAMIGLGWWTRDWAIPAVAESEYCETTVTVSSSREKAERVAEEAGATAAITYEAFHDGAAAGEYDAVYVCTPNALHLPYVETAAGLGKHVLCEKPMEATVERAEAIIDAVADSEARLMVAYRMHAEPLTRRLRELVQGGAIGEPVQVDGALCADVLHRELPDGWRLDPELAGGGALYDLGIYPLNTSRFLLGADPVAVDGDVRSDHPELSGLDEHVAFRLRFPDGVTASCRTSYHSGDDNYITVLGREGRASVEPAFSPGSDRTLTVEADGVETEVTVPTNEMVEEFDYFAHALLTGGTIGNDGAHGLVDMETMAAVYEADERGERVRL